MAALTTLLTAAALLAAATPAIEARQGTVRLIGAAMATRDGRYGSDDRQRWRLFTRGARRAPLIVYLHGGGWSAGTPLAGQGDKPGHFTARGFAYATIGYRFVPGATVEAQLAEIAGAIAALRRERGVDPDRIVLLGHSSGGHLAAMLAADPRWLDAAGVPIATVKAAILLDPAAIDVTAFLRPGAGGGTIDAFYRPAFGDDRVRQWALSPLAHAAAPNAGAWLMLHDVGNIGAAIQSQQLARELAAAGAQPVRVQPVSGTSHVRLNDEIGRPNDAATAAIDAFLATAFPQMRVPAFR